MMDTAAVQTDEGLRSGLGLDAVLAVGAVLAAVGWALTQFLASSPGLALSLVGYQATVVVVAYWTVATVGLVALAATAGAPAIRYSPLVWLWGVLVVGALAADLAVLLGVVEGSLARTLLWTPWPIVLGVGYAVTGVVAAHRTRAAYLVGALAAGLVVLAAVLFPSTVPDWAFAAIGVVHALPLLVDARIGDREATASTDRSGSRYEFRDLRNATTADDRTEDDA
jgi:hypothetical protein